MPTLQRPEGTLFYESSGTGPVVLMGHSLLCDGRMWQPILEYLTNDYRVVVVDHRGHRHSHAYAPFTLDNLVDDYVALLAHERVDKAHIVGLSMGGMVGMRMALRYPQRVKTLSLLNTSAASERLTARLKYRALAAIYSRFGFFRSLEPSIFQLMFGHPPSELCKRQFLDFIHGHNPKQLCYAIEAVSHRQSLLSRLHEIACPVAVYAGQYDRALPPARSREIHARCPDSQLHIIAEAGHLSVMEYPDKVGPLVADFLRQHR